MLIEVRRQKEKSCFYRLTCRKRNIEDEFFEALDEIRMTKDPTVFGLVKKEAPDNEL